MRRPMRLLRVPLLLPLLTVWTLLLWATPARAQQAQFISGGPTLPASCLVQSIFFKTGTGVGLYQCTATNTWTAVPTSPGAPTTATYWVASANGSLPNAKNLGALSTGLVLNTAGVPTTYVGVTCSAQFLRVVAATGAGTCATVSLTADVAGTLPVLNGGTGTTTATGSGSVVLSSGPTLVAPALGTPSALVLTNATGTPTSIGLANGTGLSLTTGVTGRLPFANLTQIAGLSLLGVTGNVTADVAAITAGTDNQVLRRSGTALSFGAVNLASSNAVTGNLPVTNLNSGTSATSSTFWRGDGTWAAPTGTGDVVGPASAVDSQLALFNSTTGKLIKAAGFTGLTLSTSGVASAYAGTSCTNQFPRSLNATGAATCASVALATDVSGNLPVGNLNAGTSASNTTFWRGDGTWATPAGSGGNVSAAGTLTSGQLVIGQGAQAVAVGNLSGDITTSGGTATTLASTAVSPASYTNTSLTVDAKGRITAASSGIGALLGYTSYKPGSDTALTIASATLTDVDATNLNVVFTVPSSGKVLVRLTAYCNSGGAGLDYWWSLREGSSDIAGAGGAAISQTGPLTISMAFTITGLTPGASTTWKWSHARATSGTGRMFAGPGGKNTPPATMEVWAAP